MSREWRLYLDDMFKSCVEIQGFTLDMTRQEFFDDNRTYDSVVRNLEIIGEAAKKSSGWRANPNPRH